MKYLKITLLSVMLVLCLSPFFMNIAVFAQTSNLPPTLIPISDDDIGGGSGACVGLATMIATGEMHLRNIPCFIKYFTQTLIGIAGSIAVVFVMVGGYRYVIGSDQSQEKAKKTITWALVGLAISLLAWVIIDLVIQVATE